MLTSLAFGLALSQASGSVLDDLRTEAKSLKTFVQTPLAKSYLRAVGNLAAPRARVIYFDERSKIYYSDDSATEPRKKVELGERFYYYTRYGTPLAYSRAVDILGKAGLESFQGANVCDFGYGGIGPLRLIIECGGKATGVDVDSLLKALYSKPEDLAGGRIHLVEGHFPTDAATVQAIGGGYDVFLSKNTLKKGYVHPEKPVDKRMLVDLGVSDLEFCKAVAKLLKPGGLFLIYNLSPAQNPPDKPYLPFADGRSPFSKGDLEKEGFEVLAFDVNDDGPAREMGRLLGWDKGANPMNFENNLFGHYTLARKK